MASFLEPEATPRIQIIDADDSHFVIYKPKRQGRSSQKTNESKGFNTHDLEQGGSTINQGSTHEKPNRTKKKPSNLEKAGLTNRTSGAQEKPKRAKTKKTRLLSRDSMNVGDIDSQLMPTRWGARSPSKSKSPRVYPMVLDEQEQASAPGSPLECEGNLQGAGFFKQPTRSSARSKDISSKSERASSTARFSESSQIFSVTTPFFEKWRCRIRSAIKDMMRFKALKFTQILLAGCILFLTFADIGPPGGLRDTETGLIVDQASAERTEKGLILVNGTERAIVGATLFQVACIGIARASAWIMYPGK